MFKNILSFVRGQSDSAALCDLEKNYYKDAIFSSVPSVEFSPNAEIISANGLFVELMGYRLDEIIGKKHKIFCDDCTVESTSYIEFWNDLRKNAEIIWLEGTYIPVLNEQGGVSSIIKLAFEITEKHKELDRYKTMLRTRQLNNLSV
jgi:methyl-accepting chemotaxis protein